MRKPKRKISETNPQSLPRDGVPIAESVTLPKIAFLDSKNLLPFERDGEKVKHEA